MTLSEVFYEAACRISHKQDYFSCIAIDMALNNRGRWSDERIEYSYLMTSDCTEVERAADALGWTRNDFRTFMLLMAAEAVK